MRYIDAILQPGESVLKNGQLHWIGFAPAAIVLGLGIVSVPLLIFILWSNPQMSKGLMIAPIAIVVIGLVSLLGTWVRYITTEIAVTNKRVIVKKGLIQRRTSEMNLSKIESVDVDQSMIGRILDFGTVTLRGTGMGLSPINFIQAPLAFRNCIRH